MPASPNQRNEDLKAVSVTSHDMNPKSENVKVLVEKSGTSLFNMGKNQAVRITRRPQVSGCFLTDKLIISSDKSLFS